MKMKISRKAFYFNSLVDVGKILPMLVEENLGIFIIKCRSLKHKYVLTNTMSYKLCRYILCIEISPFLSIHTN
jgi:hypothetical protein